MSKNWALSWESYSSPFLVNLFMNKFEMQITEVFTYILNFWYRNVNDVINLVKKNIQDPYQEKTLK